MSDVAPAADLLTAVHSAVPYVIGGILFVTLLILLVAWRDEL